MLQISRVTRTRQEARSAYNKLSRWYDLLASGFEGRPRKAAIRLLSPNKGDRVLEIGLGTGNSIGIWADLVGGSDKVYGIDLSNGMLEVAQSRLNKLGIGARVTLICGDALQLPFEADFFDKILISFTLELFDTPEIPHVLAECLRCLHGGGQISVVGLSKKNPNGMTRIYEWFHEKQPAYVDCRPIFVQEELENAGFLILQANDLSMMGLKSELVLAEKPINL
ncbi:MAG: methyltransferase domain-containing protein [Anaerolineaceae bacterium]|nr:methyltransferase domain-containing protein [Anaerolineaceae bacterium]